MLARLRREIQARAAADDRFKAVVTRVAGAIGYDLTRMTRRAYEGACQRMIEALDPGSLDVLEIAAGERWRSLPFRSYRTIGWPEYDICADDLDPAFDNSFDLIIADQVFEHLLWPYRAGRNLHRMLRPGGHALIMTPFLIRVHDGPYDCSRWTETGMKHLLAECGFPLEDTQTGSWGNLSALKATLVTWGRVGWRRDFTNDPRFPMVVWAMARKPG